MTQTTTNFDAVTAAARQVSLAVNAMNQERAELRESINALNQEKRALLDSCVSTADYRAFIGDYIDAKRAQFRGLLKDRIEDMLYPVRPGKGPGLPRVNRSPLNFEEMEGLLEPGGEAGLYPQSWIAQLVTTNKAFINDLSFYFYFGEKVKQVIDAEFDRLGILDPARFAGPAPLDRAAIRQQIADLDARIEAMEARRADLAGKIRQLGSMPKETA